MNIPRFQVHSEKMFDGVPNIPQVLNMNIHQDSQYARVTQSCEQNVPF